MAKPEEGGNGGEGAGPRELPIGAPVRVGRLDSLRAQRIALSRLFREARQRVGRYPTPLEASRLASVLAQARCYLELEVIEERLARVEQAVEGRR